MKKYVWIIILFLLILMPSIASAQDPTPTADEVNRIAKQLYCPVCESTALDQCGTEACRQWRELIRSMLADGKSEEEIKNYFVEHYGVRVLDEPPNRLITYGIPAIAFLLGAFMLFRGFRMWMKPVGAEPAEIKNEAKPVPQDDYIQKMEEELKRRK